MSHTQRSPEGVTPRPLRLGVIGCGVVSTRDVLPTLLMPEVRERLSLVAVCDVVAERAAAAAQAFGAARHYTHHEQLVQDPDVEAVCILTPVPHHLPAALAAIAAGKHVYLQKTMTLTVAEADQVIAAARNAGVKIVAAPGNHTRSQVFAEIRDHLQSGRLGKVCWGRAVKGTRQEDDARRNDDASRDVDPTWYYKPGGGPLRDAAVYDIHTLTWLLGPAKRVTAMSGIAVPVRRWRDTTIDVEMDDNTHFILDFGQSCFIVFSSEFIKDTSRVPALELYGDSGAIIVGGGSYDLIGASEERDRHGFKDRVVQTGHERAFASGQGALEHYIIGDIIHLADCILQDRAPLLSAEHARHGIEIIEKVYESARTGQTLSLTTTFAAPPTRADGRLKGGPSLHDSGAVPHVGGRAGAG